MRCRTRLLRLASLVIAGASLVSCVPAVRVYPLGPENGTATLNGSLSVERVEGGEQLVVVQLSDLPPPERLGVGLREFVVWLRDPTGLDVKAGTLRYDRAHQSGNLMATTHLRAFTVQITGERDAGVNAPSSVLLAERKVSIN